MANIPTFKLANGVEIPAIALGTWMSPDGEPVINAVKWAVEAGYNSIDTAAIYKNERGVGEGIRSCGVPRDSLFVTTKIWNGEQGYMDAQAAFARSLERLNIGYVDELLIHWPCPGNDRYVGTWRALEKLYREGQLKVIGVSNFTIRHLENLRANCELVPMVNQIELHPYFVDYELLAYCKAQNILIEAYSPLMHGGAVLQDPEVAKIAEKHGKTNAQVILRFLYQLGARLLVKSLHKARLEENLAIFDFQLDADDMIRMRALNRGMRQNPHPELDNFALPLDY